MYPTAKNQVSLIGNLGGDPEVKTFENGNQMARFSLATNERFRNKQGEYQDNTLWHTCVVFGKASEMARNALKKGDMVAVSGKLNYRQFSNSEGQNVKVTEVVVISFSRLNKREEVYNGGHTVQGQTCKPGQGVQEHLRNLPRAVKFDTSEGDKGEDVPF